MNLIKGIIFACLTLISVTTFGADCPYHDSKHQCISEATWKKQWKAQGVDPKKTLTPGEDGGFNPIAKKLG